MTPAHTTTTHRQRHAAIARGAQFLQQIMVVVHFRELGTHGSRRFRTTFTRLEDSKPRAVRPARSGSVSPNTVRTQRRRAESQSQSQCVHAGNQLLFRRSPPRPRPPGEHEAHSILSMQGRGDHTRNEARCLSLTRRAPTAQPRCRKQLPRYGHTARGRHPVSLGKPVLGATLADPWWALFST